MNTKKVSVIVPNYNHAKYLDQRIRSILSQTYENFELIILDDCSTDNSINIIEKYRSNPHVSHIVVNNQNNGSPFQQWQKGFDAAKGEYIWIAESDDYANPKFLEVLVGALEKHSDAAVAFSGMIAVDVEGNELWRLPAISSDHDRLYEGNDFVLERMLVGNAISNASCAVFRRKSLEKIKGYYTLYKASGDRMFWIEIAKTGGVYACHLDLDYWRQHSESVSPAAHRSGQQQREAYQTYIRTKELFSLSEYNCKKIVGAYMLMVFRTNDFDSRDIKMDLLDMWSKAVPHPSILLIDTIIKKIFAKVFSSFRTC